MILIKQRSDSDCVLASLAMITGKAYDELWSITDFPAQAVRENGLRGESLYDAFAHAGFVRNQTYKSVYTVNLDFHVKNALLWGRTTLVQVPSLNYDKSSHMLACDGSTVYDPSNKQTYNWIDQLASCAEYIFLFKQ